MGKSAVIIGGGIAGLSAGCYLQMNGYESDIFEMHALPGGLCTSWERGGYTFDGCIDWLTGSGPDGMMYPLWQELGVIRENSFIYAQEYCRYCSEDGTTVIFYLDPDRLEEELLRHSPEDAQGIAKLCGIIRNLKGFRPNVSRAMELMGPLGYLKMMPEMITHMQQYKTFLDYGKISMKEFAEGLKSALLKDMFSSIWNGGDIPMSLFAVTMAWCSGQTAGYPQGGSLKISRSIEKRYLELGGQIHYRQRADGILIQNNRAAGIRLADGSEIPADIVISAADGYSTLYNMLQGRYITDKIKEWYGSMPVFPPYLQISLGVRRTMHGEPRLLYLKLNEPLMIAGQETSYMIIHNYAFDPSLSPEGKTSLIVRFFTTYDYWQELYKDKKRYREEKEALSASVIGVLDSIYSGIKDDIEVIDVATPATYVRYTNTWKGATMGWLPTTANFSKSIEKTLPGLEGFYMAGQWLVPGGGVPNAMKTARDCVQIICRQDQKKFASFAAEK